MVKKSTEKWMHQYQRAGAMNPIKFHGDDMGNAHVSIVVILLMGITLGLGTRQFWARRNIVCWTAENSTINRRKIEFVGTINDNVFFLLKTIGLCIFTFNFYAFVVQVDFLKFLSAKVQVVDKDKLPWGIVFNP